MQHTHYLQIIRTIITFTQKITLLPISVMLTDITLQGHVTLCKLAVIKKVS